MSNNQSNQASAPQKPTKIIEVGKFYLIYDGSPTGHPGYVISKDDVNNLYLVIRLDSDKPGETTKESRGVRHITKLKHPTSADVVNSYVKNRPTMCKRKDIGSKVLEGIAFNSEDLGIINEVSSHTPEYSRSFKKKK